MKTTTKKQKGRAPAKNATPTTTGNDHSATAALAHRYRGNSAEAQRARLLRALRRGPVDTVRAYRKLDILHVPRRIFELRQAGYRIATTWVWRISEAGQRHRVGLYSLEAA